jgi:hypothetical protein
MLNSPLREEPRNKRAPVIRTTNEFVILDWLKSTGRLMERTPQESEDLNEVEEISEIIDIDEIPYDPEEDEVGIDLED